MKQTKKQSTWVYECEPDNTSRYVLGEQFADPQSNKVLICIGVNPSTATPEKLDPTLNRVRRYAERQSYGAWYMLNLYPQRATDPNDMDREGNRTLHQKNIAAIGDLLRTIPQADVWCAWGATIRKRSYLSDFLRGNKEREISGILAQFNGDYRFVAYAETKKGHPGHPLVMKTIDVLKPINQFQKLDIKSEDETI